MQGLGFLVWKLSSMPEVNELIGMLQTHQVRWVSVKVADGRSKFNVRGGDDGPLLAWIGALKAAGIHVGGWHYVYYDEPGPQGDLAEERRQKLGLQHLLVDAEVEWVQPYGAGARAKLYMSKIKRGGFEAGLCSFRYPQYFPGFPFAAFLGHENADFNAPQVYPIGAHNFGQQTLQSKEQYDLLTDKPFVPIGPTFGAALQNGGWWEPTTGDLQEFVANAQAQGYPGYGFYSLDWIIDNGRWDWLEAISGVTAPPPPPPPEPGPGLTMRVIVDVLNVRSGPGVNYPDIGDLQRGQMVRVEDVAGSEAWVRIGEGQWACVRRGGRSYLERV